MEDTSSYGGQKSLQQPPCNAGQVMEVMEVPWLDRAGHPDPSVTLVFSIRKQLRLSPCMSKETHWLAASEPVHWILRNTRLANGVVEQGTDLTSFTPLKSRL